MANVQSQFEEFHNAIKLEWDDNQTLREKRDIVIRKLNERLPKDVPSFTTFNQGSYAMHTGIKPLDDGQYDIDVGLWFDMSADDYPDPVVTKQWVYDALYNHTDDVRIKEPCVTVTYKENGKPRYHIDLTVYAANNPDGKVYLARGKQHSDAKYRRWEESEPKKLQDKIQSYLSDERDRAQFRRVIRYMKRWKDVKFANVDRKPSGIGLTVAGLSYFSPRYETDLFSNSRSYNDLDALTNFVQALINAFSYVSSSESDGVVQRLKVHLPVAPYTDIFSKMTDKQMSEFLDKLNKLLLALKSAKDDVDPVSACETLRKQFGDDFPVPEQSATAKRTSRPSIISESSSA